MLKRIVQACYLCDLRFSDTDAEAAFKQSLQREVVRVCQAIEVVSLFSILFTFLGIYVRESNRPDSPFMWDASDPRTLYFSTVCINFVMFALLLTLSTMYLRFGCFRWVNWELVMTGSCILFMPSLFFFSAWHVATMYGADPQLVWLHDTSASEVLVVLSIITAEISVCIYAPLRTCVMWIVPLVASLSYTIVSIVVGSPFPSASARVAIFLTVISAFVYGGTLRHERHVRDKWQAVEQAKEHELVASGMRVLTGTLSDVVLQLDVDMRVVQSTVIHQAFFGQPIEGRLLAEFLDSSDQEKLHKLALKALESLELQSMPATLELSCARCKAQLCIVCIRGKSTHYLAGINQLEHIPKMQVDSVDEDVTLQRDLVSTQDDRASASVISTTVTDRVFNDIDRLDLTAAGDDAETLRRTLTHIAEVGVRERWLVGAEDVRIVPDMVLGKGGFGCVALGVLRNTAVAVKLPLSPRDSSLDSSVRKLRELSSLCNELRVHRRVRHPNIVAFHGAYIDPSFAEFALLYELVQGLRMDEFVEKLTQGTEGLLRLKLLVDVSGALEYLHDIRPQVVHGDIKGSNVMIEEFKHVGARAKLLDFGIARVLTKSAKRLGGTKLFMAPEVLSQQDDTAGSRAGYPRPAASADVFSFGLLAYMTMSGTKPNRRLQGEKVPTLQWPTNTPFLEEVRDFCQKLLQMNPKARPAMCMVLELLLDIMGERMVRDSMYLDVIALFLSEGLPCGEARTLLYNEMLEGTRKEVAAKESGAGDGMIEQRIAPGLGHIEL